MGPPRSVFSLLLVFSQIAAAADSPSSEPTCAQPDTPTPESCSAPPEEQRQTPPAGLPTPVAVSSSDDLRVTLAKSPDEALPLLVRAGKAPPNVTLHQVDDGDLPAIATLLATAPTLRVLELSEHSLSLVGIADLATALNTAAPHVEFLVLGEREVALAPLRPGAPTTELELQGSSLSRIARSTCTTVVTSFRGMLKVDLTSVKVPYRRTFDICPSFWLHRAFECGQLVNRGVARSAKSILRSRRAGDSLEGSRGPQTPPSGTHKPRPADAGK